MDYGLRSMVDSLWSKPFLGPAVLSNLYILSIPFFFVHR